MSCSLIEAKFQVLDATIKLLSKSKDQRAPKVASSEELRKLVASQTPTSLLPASKGVGSTTATRFKQTGRARSARSSVATLDRTQSRERTSDEKHSGPRRTGSRPSTGRESRESSSTDLQEAAWVDPKQQRVQQLLQDTWGEIEAAVNWDVPNESSSALGSKILHSRLLVERDETTEDSSAQQTEGNQVQDHRDSPSAVIHNALPAPKRPLRLMSSCLKDRASGRPVSGRKALVGRCRSADPAALSNPEHLPKNWFAPSNIGKDGVSSRIHSRLPKVKRKPDSKDRRPVSSAESAKRPARQQDSSSSARAELQTTPNDRVSEEVRPEVESWPPKIDDPAFYRLEVRLDHPEPLTTWRFQALFTDMSVCPTKAVVLDDLTVDEDNCLLFHDKNTSTGSVVSRYFDPLTQFSGISQPSDLYGHVLRIIVTSSHPVNRIVVNTCVQFTVTPDEAAVLPPGELERFPAPFNGDTSLQRMLTRRNRSAASKKKPKTKSCNRSVLSRDESTMHGISTNSLAMDPAFECSPWGSEEQDDVPEEPASLEAAPTLSLQPLQLTDAHGLPFATDERYETQEAGTIDRKKMQLQRLRASMRRQMREEKQLQLQLQARQQQDEM